MSNIQDRFSPIVKSVADSLKDDFIKAYKDTIPDPEAVWEKVFSGAMLVLSLEMMTSLSKGDKIEPVEKMDIDKQAEEGMDKIDSGENK